MKLARKYVLLGLAVVLLAALLSGCSVIPAPRYGNIKICTDDSDIYGDVSLIANILDTALMEQNGVPQLYIQDGLL